MKKIISITLGVVLAVSSIGVQAETFALRFYSKGLTGVVDLGTPGSGSSGPADSPSGGGAGETGGTGGTGGAGGTEGIGGSGGTGGTGGAGNDTPVVTPPVEVKPAPGYSASQFTPGIRNTIRTLTNNTGETPTITNCLRTPPGGPATPCTAKDSWPTGWPMGLGLQGIEADNTYRIYLGNGQVVNWLPQSETVSVQ